MAKAYLHLYVRNAFPFYQTHSKQSYLQKIDCKAIREALNYKIVPKTWRRFVDNSYAGFQERTHADKSLEILNKQDPPIKCTAEFEDHKHSLSFLDINITNNTTNKKYEFKVHRKDAITNIHIKTNSFIHRSITRCVFKGFLHRAHVICSEKHIKGEIQFLIGMFVGNGHKRTFLENSVKVFKAKKKNNDSCNYTTSKKILWVPNIGQKIRKQFKKINKVIIFTYSRNLQSILCQKKSELVPNGHTGEYHLDCSYNGRHIGESKKKVLAPYWQKIIGSHPTLLNTTKSIMDNSTEFT